MLIDLKAAQLLCSRICHDIIGPVGAVNTGLELLAEGETPDDGALALVSDSAQQLSRRLAYYRVAFGSGGGVGPGAVSEARDLALGFAGAGKVSIEWDADGARELDGKMSADGIKLSLVLIFLACEALPRGGTVAVRAEELAEGVRLTVTAAGTGVRLREGIGDALSETVEVEDLSAHSVIAHFARCLASRAATGIEFSSDDGEVHLTAVLPPGSGVT